MDIRRAQKTDAPELAPLIDSAGYGIPSLFWSKLKTADQTTLESGIAQTKLDEGAFSYSHAYVAEIDGRVAAALAGHVLSLEDMPTAPDALPAFLQPILALEKAAVGTWYINAIATAAEFQCRGVASKMLVFAEHLATEAGTEELSLVVNSNNSHARNLYEREGFLDYDVRQVVPPPDIDLSGNWVLMKKTIELHQ